MNKGHVLVHSLEQSEYVDEGEMADDFFNAIVSRYQADEVASRNPLCSRCFIRERERAAFIRSPKCKSSRGINHMALRLKTVGVINHLAGAAYI